MSVPIHSVSAKIAAKGLLLMISARADMHVVPATIDLSSPETTISTQLARRFTQTAPADEAQPVTGRHVVGIADIEVPLRRVKVADLPGPAEIVLGSDFIRTFPILLDFGRGTLSLPTSRQYRHLTAEMVSVPLRANAAGCVQLQPDEGDGIALGAAPGTSHGQPDPRQIRLGGMVFDALAAPIDSGACRGRSALGWEMFKGHRVLIDVAGGRLWISRGAS